MLALACLACGPGRQPVYPFKGKVLVDGKPAARAVVLFFPLGPNGLESGLDVLHPQGVVDESGAFELTTYTPNDGAPAANLAFQIAYNLLYASP